MSATQRGLIAAAIILDFVAPRLSNRLANWLHSKAIDQALAYQRGQR